MNTKNQTSSFPSSNKINFAVIINGLTFETENNRIREDNAEKINTNLCEFDKIAKSQYNKKDLLKYGNLVMVNFYYLGYIGNNQEVCLELGEVIFDLNNNTFICEKLDEIFLFFL